MEIIILLSALIAGLIARTLSLPPMVGYLAAGFAISSLHRYWPTLETVDFTILVDVGVTLLLFTIGLKLDLRSLVRPFVWAVTCIHMGLVVGIMCALLLLLKVLGWMWLSDLTLEQALTIGFALSFSSTVFAVSLLQDRGEMASLHGKTAIGILVMQDIIAVVYLSVSGGSLPAWYASLVVLIIPFRGVLVMLLKRCGHGELLVLAGFALAFGAYGLFDLVGLKGDLGALFIGALLAGTSKGKELVKSLLTIKDLLLIGFFLSIGQYGLPSGDAWGMVLLLALLVFIKPLLYFVLFTRFHLRDHTSLFGALSLNHYSEFGLIVLTIAISSEVVPAEWLVILALALSLSFVFSSVINVFSDTLYAKLHSLLAKMQTDARVLEQQPIDIQDARVLVMGMGRLGAGVYDFLESSYDDRIVGFEENEQKALAHTKAGRRVIVGDASDRDLWERLPHQQVKKVILALSNHHETMMVTEILRQCGFTGMIAAVAKFDDDLEELKSKGVIAFNFYKEAGAGFAEHVVNNWVSQEETAQAALTD